MLPVATGIRRLHSLSPNGRAGPTQGRDSAPRSVDGTHGVVCSTKSLGCFPQNPTLPFDFLLKHNPGTGRQERVKKKIWSSYFFDFVSMNLFHGTAVKSGNETGLLLSPDNTNCCCSCILSDSSKMKIEMNRSTNETLFCFDFPNVTVLFVSSVSNI